MFSHKRKNYSFLIIAECLLGLVLCFYCFQIFYINPVSAASADGTACTFTSSCNKTCGADECSGDKFCSGANDSYQKCDVHSCYTKTTNSTRDGLQAAATDLNYQNKTWSGVCGTSKNVNTKIEDCGGRGCNAGKCYGDCDTPKDCGTDGLDGKSFCKDYGEGGVCHWYGGCATSYTGDLYQKNITYSCNSQNTDSESNSSCRPLYISKVCSSTSKDQLVEKCQYGCDSSVNKCISKFSASCSVVNDDKKFKVGDDITFKVTFLGGSNANGYSCTWKIGSTDSSGNGELQGNWGEELITSGQETTRTYRIAQEGADFVTVIAKSSDGQTEQVKCSVDTDKPIVSLYLDPDYIIETANGRNFIPQEPISPYDDIVCELKMKKSDGAKDKTFEGSLLVSGSSSDSSDSDDSNSKPAINSGPLVYEESDDKYDYYQWRIQGWDDGKMPSIATVAPFGGSGVSPEIYNDPHIQCEVKIDNSNDNNTEVSPLRPASLCAHIWGSSAFKNGENTNFFKIAVASEISTDDAAKQALKLKNTLSGIDPFGTYIDNFGIYADVAKIESDSTSDSVCKSMNVYYLYSSKNRIDGPLGVNYLPSLNGKGLIMIYPSVAKYPDVLAHELGHSFGLRDEYAFETQGLASSSSLTSNCAIPNASYSSVGCVNFLKAINGYSDGCYKSCGPTNYYRSTVDSIMNDMPNSGKFNKVSCAFILNKIESGFTFTQLYDQCRDLKLDQGCNKDSDCSLDTSRQEVGCEKCVSNECQKSKLGSDCWSKSLSKPSARIVAGLCNSFGGLFTDVYCDIFPNNQALECNSLVPCTSPKTCNLKTYKCE